MDISDIFLPRPRKLDSDEVGGISSFGGVLKKALENYRSLTQAQGENYNNTILKEKARNAPQMSDADLANLKATIAGTEATTNRTNQLTPLEVIKQKIANQYAPGLNQASINSSNASANSSNATANRTNQLTPLEVIKQGIENKYLPGKEEASQKETEARAKYYESGGFGSKGTARQQEEKGYIENVSKDNPQLETPEEKREAAEVIRNGGHILSNGKILNPPSNATKDSIIALNKAHTTASLANSGINSQKADAAIKSISKNATEWLKPYGDTILGYNPQQVVDSFKNDDASQERLGKFIAAQQLQYTLAQEETRLAMVQGGIGNTKLLIDKGRQIINDRYPMLSQKARENAQKYYLQALDEMSKERNKVGVTYSDIPGINGNKIIKDVVTSKQGANNEGKMPSEGMIWMENPKTHEQFEIHKSNVEIAKRGYKGHPALVEVM